MNNLIERLRLHDDERLYREADVLMSEAADALEELADCEESNRAVELALDDVDYKGSFADGVLYLKAQVKELAAALALRDEALEPFAEEPSERMDSYPCHSGLTTKEKCGRCSRAIAAYNALATKPHAALVNKIKADAVREYHKTLQTLDGYPISALVYADCIEKGEV